MRAADELEDKVQLMLVRGAARNATQRDLNLKTIGSQRMVFPHAASSHAGWIERVRNRYFDGQYSRHYDDTVTFMKYIATYWHVLGQQGDLVRLLPRLAPCQGDMCGLFTEDSVPFASHSFSPSSHPCANPDRALVPLPQTNPTKHSPTSCSTPSSKGIGQ